ncbi:MAG: aldolase/citrate lyase family protein [Dehalococcoidia bacterium]|nr:aldolase/citrate lyase family protein [Dehalococcoidia bacterium]
MNAVKDLLKSGKTVVGTGGTPHPDLAGILADSGFDFILFDTQHAPLEIHQLIPAIQATNGKKAAPIVRVSDNRPDLICFALDAGARGIVVPMVNTKEEAEAMVDSCMYYPKGSRSNSGPRGEWGDYNTYRDYLDMANDGMVIAPMIETNRAIKNAEDIASVDGVDILLVGPSDLSIELEVPLQFESDTYQAGLDKIANACAKHGVVPGMYFIPPEMDPNFFVEKGFKFFTQQWAPMASYGIQKHLTGINR